METTDVIVITAAILVGLLVGLPQLLERRGKLWKEMAEEREAALKNHQQELNSKEQELKDAQQRIKDLEIRTDLTALQEGIIKEREQGVLLVKAELASVQKIIVETEERMLTSYEAHENRAQERHEKVVIALEALTEKLVQ